MAFGVTENNSVSERMRITSGGSVGIHTTSPNVGSANSERGVLTIGSTDNGSANNYANLELQGHAISNDVTVGDISFYDHTNQNAIVRGGRDLGTTTGFLSFFTNGGSGVAQRMRIDSSGNVGIGDNPTSSQRFYAKGDIGGGYAATFFNDGNNANRYGIRIIAGTDDGSGNNYHLSAMDGDGDLEGALRVDSGTFSLYDNSDRRLKDNIRDTKINGTDIVNSMKVRDFEWKKNGLTETAGFVAQELKESFEPASPDSEDDLYEGKPKMMAISRDRLVPVLVKAIQELSAKVEALENA
jgi:hypothetical protein